jgi:hypothetical protein
MRIIAFVTEMGSLSATLSTSASPERHPGSSLPAGRPTGRGTSIHAVDGDVAPVQKVQRALQMSAMGRAMFVHGE